MRAAALLAAVLLSACTPAAVPDTDTTPTSVASTSSTFAATTTPATTAPVTTTTLEDLDADVVLYNGTVLTVDADSTIATGIAVSGDRIVAVGDGQELLRRAPEATGLDLEGRTVIPGIVDPHIHLEQNQTPDYGQMMAEERRLAESGRTTLGVPAIIPINLEGYRNIEERGGPLLRSHFYLAVNTACGDPVESEGWWEHYDFDRSADLRFAFAGIKLFADGGACNDPAFSFDWIDGTQGDLYVDSGDVADLLRRADALGALVVVHAIGDRAVDTVLTGFQQALGGNNPNRHRIDHNTLVHEDWITRYGEVGANFVGWSWFNSCLEQVGAGWESLGTRHLPWLRTHKAVMEANPNITVAWHSDAPYSPVSIFEHFLSLTTFISLDENGEPCAPPAWMSGKEVDIETALRMMTLRAAAVMDLDADLGSVEVGKIADLAILEQNPFDQVGMALLDNRVVSTWTSGFPVWCSDWDACAALKPSEPDRPGVVQGMTASASSSRDVHLPGLVLDGSTDGESFWSSGVDAPAWIQVDFDEPAILEGLRFVVFQNPPSDTVHVLELLVGGVWSEAHRFEGFTTTGDVLEWVPDAPTPGVEAFRMTTTESASWPEWYEIVVTSR